MLNNVFQIYGFKVIYSNMYKSDALAYTTPFEDNNLTEFDKPKNYVSTKHLQDHRCFVKKNIDNLLKILSLTVKYQYVNKSAKYFVSFFYINNFKWIFIYSINF